MTVVGERHGLNFASQDYLGLSTDPRVLHAAMEAARKWGVHSAGSPALQGNGPETDALAQELGAALGYEHCVLFSTGWSAGFGVMSALVRRGDVVLLDQYAHNCLVTGAQAATPTVSRYRHLDLTAVESRLKRARSAKPRGPILVVTEGLFSMDADSPELRPLVELCRTHDATLLVDVAHDFGAIGPAGSGRIGECGLLGGVDLVMGSFSKTFAANGGFVLTRSRAVAEYLRVYAASHVFSNALSPMAIAIVRTVLAIVRSEEGEHRRAALKAAAVALRTGLQREGIEVLGRPSPIVPVPVGSEAVARVAARSCADAGILANLVEYPAVTRGLARFRMQCMATHTPEMASHAAREIAAAIRNAEIEVAEVASR
jgi:7-keto-8-aminopelargonate synthetase-like enzyme